MSCQAQQRDKVHPPSLNPWRLILELQDLVLVGNALEKGRHQLADRWKETNGEPAGQTGRGIKVDQLIVTGEV